MQQSWSELDDKVNELKQQTLVRLLGFYFQPSKKDKCFPLGF